MKKWSVSGCIIAALATAGYFLYPKLIHPVDKTVSQPYNAPNLTVEQIRTQLNSGDFKQKLEAGKQIDKLAPEEKLHVLLALSHDTESSSRMLAIKKMKSLEDPRAKERITEMAKSDPDTDVRELAGGVQ
jgi:hypothetical protein